MVIEDDLYSQVALIQSEVAMGCWYGEKGSMRERSSELSLIGVGL